MFDHDHYVPVIRWKGAERKAVQNLRSEVRDHITPLVELVPKHFREKPIEVAAKELAESWGWNRLCFVDFHLLPEDAMRTAIPRFVKRASGYKIKLALVTGLTRGLTYQEGIRESLEATGCDLCLRVQPHDFRSGGIGLLIDKALSTFRIGKSSVHLILDFQFIADEPPNLLAWEKRIPMLTSWRTFTALSGAFPKDLANLERNTQHILPRSDLWAWAAHLAEAKGRLPSFGDYTVQHGLFEEHEGKQLNFSASLRYAGTSDWVVMRGEGVLNEDGPGYAQWPAQAELLCEREEFVGEDFSWGDGFIKEMSLQGFKTGTAKDWLAATINHHITLTALQVANPASVTNNAVPSRGSR